MTEPVLLLHQGTTAHARHTPFTHSFRYRMWMVSIDLDRLGQPGTILFRRGRLGILSLHEADHGPRDGTPLLPWVRGRLAEADLAEYGASIRMMLIPRVLGFAFNPIAFYFCRDAAGRLGAVLHQVKNTFGDQHAYLLPVPPGPGLVQQHAAKRLHVSPFFDMQGGYRFSFRAPDFTCGDRFDIAIRYGTVDQPRLTATLNLATVPATTPRLLRLLVTQALLPFKVVAAIHTQALRLWLRGATFHRVPAHNPALTMENPT